MSDIPAPDMSHNGPMSDVDRETLVGVISEHGFLYQDIGPIHYVCHCGEHFLNRERWAVHVAVVAFGETLAQVKATARAEAWDEGWDARNDDYWSGDRNPYRSPSAPTDGGAQ